MLQFRARTITFARLWEHKSKIPLAFIGLLYLAAYALQVVYAENRILFDAMESLSQVIWAIFLLDVLIRLSGATSLKVFLVSSWLEILALAVPFMRLLRFFRIVVALRGLKSLVTSRASATGMYILMLVPLTWFAGAIAVLDAEASAPQATITNLRDALWWSLATITTVGYGDKYPTTVEGQLIAAVLMLTGIALFSAGAGIFASWMAAEKKSH